MNLEHNLPEFLPEAIICRDTDQAYSVRNQIGEQPNIHVIHAHAGVSEFCQTAYAKITVCEGVNLRRLMSCGCTLETLLRQRQMTWGDRAVFVVL